MPHLLHTVDVFAVGPYTGNPLAVVLDAADLDTATMQAIAREMDYSETTFVVGGDAGGGRFAVRIFTPAEEIPFAGHPTLGTAWVLRRHVAPGVGNVLELELGVGRVPVRFEGAGAEELVWLRAPEAELGERVAPEELAPALGLAPSDFARDLPAQVVRAGLSFLVAPLAGLDALRRSRFDPTAFAPLARRGIPPFVHLFCSETHGAANDLCARFFFEARGVREDPATGSATGALGGYLLHHRHGGGALPRLRVEQGQEIQRPSLLHLRSEEGRIFVGGRVLPVVEGRIL